MTIDPELAAKLSFDAIGIDYLPPLYIDVGNEDDGRFCIKGGKLNSGDDLKKMKLPDPDNHLMYKPAIEFLEKYKGEFALYARIRLGASASLLSLGTENFAYKLVDNPDYIHEVLYKYTEWSKRVSKNLSELGFDFLWAFDDIAFKSALMFSPATFKNIFLPYLKKSVEGISIPWIFHSDGNILSIIDDLLDLGMSGLHPLEPKAMDLEMLKANYGKKVCLLGNIDLDYTLTMGTIDEVDKEVRERILQMADILLPVPTVCHIIVSQKTLLL